MKRFVFAFAIALALTATACGSGWSVSAAPAKAADFSKYKTFSFSTDAAKLPQGFAPGPLSQDARDKTQNEIEANLKAKGYTRQEADADLVIVIGVGTKTRRVSAGGLTDSTTFRDGTIVVEVADKGGNLVFEGTVDASLDTSQSLDWTKLPPAVKEMMLTFPNAH